ncbi:hypothetical protein BGZ95_006008 [Linnemannia exigua]|uniref:Uncharacterized protein n=1 Tax=Linnemannia exigua TaxID=604196 RepID=A0AAD4DGD8_9FUNG|nr:hypothetical protein BGZ95_006008 [Linnemannia exigua]
MSTRAIHASKAAAPMLSSFMSRTHRLPMTRTASTPLTRLSSPQCHLQRTMPALTTMLSQKRFLSSSSSVSGSKDLTRATALVYSEYGRPTEVLK